MIIRLNNRSKNFYAHLGKVFGSRKVQKITGDRFYDDDSKEWYIYYKSGVPVAFVSVASCVIKNVWSEDMDMLVQTLKEVYKKEIITDSIVPASFEKQYEKAGFSILTNGYTNFIKIRGRKDE